MHKIFVIIIFLFTFVIVEREGIEPYKKTAKVFYLHRHAPLKEPAGGIKPPDQM
jgi:hypothetical protein